ncbi:zinc-dependent metalloprotease [Tessaracoccus sp. OS52]|uniref:zinc-dependent metalloprotease n=1 Tax=Tessaracoccus sp. OS52 TaxID=2886691 RepID=UPI001D0FE388|nr:zinc-dependent metalloprotease [Tessaracoccus sp. OS52]MCC2594422.1 zinc-dependent metalloprotease [Tessaracoccus sp. OS52]
MQLRPHVNWTLARGLAGSFQGDLPEVSRADAHQSVASLRLAAARAGELAVRFSALDGEPAGNVLVTDRTSWAKGVVAMADHVLDSLPLEARSDGLRKRLTGLGYGSLGGLALGFIGRHLLGQFDAFSPQRALYLLAPNIVALQRARGLVPADFHLWVAVHEQTHAVQFSASPWLVDYLMERFVAVAADDVSAAETVRGLTTGRGVGSAVVSAAGQTALDEITSAMTLIEGHADYVSDAVGRRHVPTVKQLRRAFARDGAPPRLARLLPALDKAAQYRDGLAFCRVVARRVGRRGLAKAFAAPENLPTGAEIADPAAWLRRVHGKA